MDLDIKEGDEFTFVEPVLEMGVYQGVYKIFKISYPREGFGNTVCILTSANRFPITTTAMTLKILLDEGIAIRGIHPYE